MPENLSERGYLDLLASGRPLTVHPAEVGPAAPVCSSSFNINALHELGRMRYVRGSLSSAVPIRDMLAVSQDGLRESVQKTHVSLIGRLRWPNFVLVPFGRDCPEQMREMLDRKWVGWPRHLLAWLDAAGYWHWALGRPEKAIECLEKAESGCYEDMCCRGVAQLAREWMRIGQDKRQCLRYTRYARTLATTYMECERGCCALHAETFMRYLGDRRRAAQCLKQAEESKGGTFSLYRIALLWLGLLDSEVRALECAAMAGKEEGLPTLEGAIFWFRMTGGRSKPHSYLECLGTKPLLWPDCCECAEIAAVVLDDLELARHYLLRAVDDADESIALTAVAERFHLILHDTKTAQDLLRHAILLGDEPQRIREGCLTIGCEHLLEEMKCRR